MSKLLFFATTDVAALVGVVNSGMLDAFSKLSAVGVFGVVLIVILWRYPQEQRRLLEQQSAAHLREVEAFTKNSEQRQRSEMEKLDGLIGIVRRSHQLLSKETTRITDTQKEIASTLAKLSEQQAVIMATMATASREAVKKEEA